MNELLLTIDDDLLGRLGETTSEDEVHRIVCEVIDSRISEQLEGSFSTVLATFAGVELSVTPRVLVHPPDVVAALAVAALPGDVRAFFARAAEREESVLLVGP